MDTLPENVKCIVETKSGPICGIIIENEEGKQYKFKKIPYAKPPLGNLRFAPPSPVVTWTNLVDCTQDAPLPLSLDINHKCQGSEDCLYIEVNTPNIKPDKPLPVMFWIGSCQYVYYIDHLYDAALINNEDVVFVRCGFRIGPMGFLSTNEFHAPGNSGLKDIVMALKWIKSNISIFGGDPNNVTLFGSSTGAATVHYMMLSPMAAGLFHKALMQSSTALHTFALSLNPSRATTDLAESLGISALQKHEVVEQLKKKTAEEIMEAYIVIISKLIDIDGQCFDAVFKPCVETEFEGQPTFLNKSPGLILKSGNFNKVPIIIGSQNIEASIIQYKSKEFYENFFEKFYKDISMLIPNSIACVDSVSKKIGLQLLNFYFDGKESINEHTRTQYLQLISDYDFLCYLNKAVRLHSQVVPESPIYYYILNYAGEWNVPKEMKFLNSLGHYAEVAFLFRFISSNASHCNGSRDSIKTRKKFIRLWTNFAKYGNPTPDENDPLLQIKWDPVENEDKLNYLSIGSELTKGRNPFHERMMFWEEMHEEHTLLRVMNYFDQKGMPMY